MSHSYEEVREMECRLFFSRFQNPETILRMQEKFGYVCANRSAYQADALKLGLKSALEIKKRNGLIGKGVMLKCRERNCPGNKTYTSYHLESVVKNEFCQPCLKIGQERFLICESCGHERKGRDTWCRGCGKKYVLVASFPS